MSVEGKNKNINLSKTIVKVAGLFSGLQVVNIICSIIKTKLIAIWLHASGIGLFGIYNSTIETIATFTDLGIRQSSIRDIAMAGDNKQRLRLVVATVRRWSMFAGLLGAVVISAAAPVLAHFMFGDWTMMWGFVVLSVCMFANAVFNGEQSILQGTGKLKRLARSGVIGSTIGLLLSIPMFRYWKDASVIPSIIVYSAANLVTIIFLRHKDKEDKSKKHSLRTIIDTGKGFVKLGISLSVATMITNIAHLTFLTYLNSAGSLEEVGFYHAGSTLVIRYVGLIFTAVAVEFYPRLSANSHSKKRMQTFVSHEISLILLVITPVIILFLQFRSLIIQILYSQQFNVIIPFVSWAIICSIFKTVSHCIAYTIIARGDGLIYIITEATDACIGLALNIILYNIFGLTGIGIAYILWYLIYCLIVGFVYHRRYKMRLSKGTLHTIAISIIISFSALLCVNILPTIPCCLIMGAVVLIYMYIIKRFYQGNRHFKKL